MYIAVGATVQQALEGLQIVDLPFFAGIWRQEAYDCTKFATDPMFGAEQQASFESPWKSM